MELKMGDIDDPEKRGGSRPEIKSAMIYFRFATGHLGDVLARGTTLLASLITVLSD